MSVVVDTLALAALWEHLGERPGPHRWVSARGLGDEGWRGWDEDLARWLARRERFGEAALTAWFYEDGPKVPDYPAWRAAVLSVLDTASDRVLEALAHDRVIASERLR